MLAPKACALELARYLRVASIQLSRGSVNVKAISRQFLENPQFSAWVHEMGARLGRGRERFDRLTSEMYGRHSKITQPFT